MLVLVWECVVVVAMCAAIDVIREVVDKYYVAEILKPSQITQVVSIKS